MEFRLDSQLKWRLAEAGSGLAPRTPYRLGELAEVSAALPDAVELRGWSAIEENGAWSDGPEAHVDVTMAADSRGRALDAILWLSPFAGPQGDQRLRVHAAGETLGLGRLNVPVIVRIGVPAWTDPRRPVRLSFELPDCATPESLGLGTDRRHLGVKLAALAIVRRGQAAPSFAAAADWPQLQLGPQGAMSAPLEAEPEEASQSAISPLPALTGALVTESIVRIGPNAIPGISLSGFESAGGPDGRWTLGRQASVRLAWRNAPAEPWAADLLLAGYVPGQHAQDVTIMCDEVTIGRLLIDGGDEAAHLVRVPVSGTGCTITLSLPLATSPRAEGESIDDRLLGVRLASVRLGPRRLPPVAAMRPAGSGFADFTATQGIVRAAGLPRQRAGILTWTRGAFRRRAERVRQFFTGGIDRRTRMAAQMTGDVLRAIEALERGLEGRNEALSEAMRAASEVQGRQLAARLSEFRADLDMRVASINAAISGLASRQSEIELSISNITHPEAGAFTQVARSLDATSAALQSGFSSLSASLHRAIMGQHDEVVDGIGGLRAEFAALDAELRTRLAGAASTLKAGFGSLSESLRRNLQASTGGFALLGEEAGAVRLRLAEMEAALSEHVSGAAAQMRMGLAQVANLADQSGRLDKLTALFESAAVQDARLKELIALVADATDQSARLAELSELVAGMRDSGSSGEAQRAKALTLISGEISAFRAEIEGRISLLGDTTRQFSGTALQMLHAQQDALGEATTRLGMLSEGAARPLSELAEMKAMLARHAERIEEQFERDANLLVSAHRKLDASAHRLAIDLDAQTKAIRTPQGFLLVPRLDQQLVLMLIESAGAYEPGLSTVIGRIVKPGMRVADVGANVGYHALYMARLVGPRGWVSAIEPIPDLAKMLERMLMLNNVSNHAEVVIAAAGSPPREQSFHIGQTSGHSSLFPLAGSPGSITVNVRELDKLVPPGAKVDFVKIDAEGAEREVFAGMTTLLRNPDISIAMEFAPSLLKRAGVEPEALLQDIARAGFEIFLINEPDGRLLSVSAEPLLAISGCNILLVRPGARDWPLVTDQIAPP